MDHRAITERPAILAYKLCHAVCASSHISRSEQEVRFDDHSAPNLLCLEVWQYVSYPVDDVRIALCAIYYTHMAHCLQC